VRTFGLESGYPMVALLAFTPQVTVGGVVVVLTAVATRQWGPAAVAAVCVLVLAVLVAPRGLGGADEPAPAAGRTLRVMTANLHLGRVPAAHLTRLVREHRVDVLAVQELTARLADDLDRAGLRRTLPRATSGFGPLGHGSAVYTRLDATPKRLGGETLNALVAIRGRWPQVGSFDVVVVHPPPPTRKRVERWREDLRRLPGPDGEGSRILAGDFNATLDHRELRRLLDLGYSDAAADVGSGWRATWPAGGRGMPGVAIDHVLIDESWSARRVTTHGLPGSDHRAVLAELAPRGPRVLRP
jgi:endonuclease/exonuclease/phosphatase (EEP) superfamily protein YafD